MPLRNSLHAPAFGQSAMGQTVKERQALDQLFSLAYEELRRLAWSVKRSDPSNTLSATALVNEAVEIFAECRRELTQNSIYFLMGAPEWLPHCRRLAGRLEIQITA